MSATEVVWLCKQCDSQLEKRVLERDPSGRELSAEWWCPSCEVRCGFFVRIDEGKLDLGL
jgi:predicted RNA-binding Zn-ribbon protein involved in translation (DUF1610 family)